MTDRLSPVTLADLVAVGFVHVATWEADHSGRLRLNRNVPKGPGVYLFVVDDIVRYVGVGERLSIRVGSYARTLHRATLTRPVQYPNRIRSVHRGIKALVDSNQSVELYTLAVEPRWETSWLPIDRLKGLESGLIAALKPQWNHR
jgi:hypothetical protein